MIRRSLAWSLAALLVALPMAPLAAEPEGEERADTKLEATTAEALEAAIAAGSTRRGADDLYRTAVLEHGGVDELVATLEGIVADESAAEARRAGARWVLGHVRRREGRLEQALPPFEALAQAGDVRAALEVASLCDALGRARRAWDTWKAALPKLEDPAERLDVRVRMALLGRSGSKSVQAALAEVAREQDLDPALRNRAAIVLALKGHPKDALALFVSESTGRDRFREQGRLAEWALAAKDPKAAQAHAWDAYTSATLTRDRRFALTLLVEAHRRDESLQALIDRFAKTPDLEDAAREVWIDLLRETGQVDEALRLFREGAEGQWSVDMRRELLELCRESGKAQVLVDAYKEMIAAEPAVIEWREGLSRHHLERGDRDAAVAVWSSYLEDPELSKYLLSAASALQGIGLDAEAERFAKVARERGASTPAALLFLFGLHKARGRMDLAEQELEALDAFAGPSDAARIQLAEAYEQLGKKKRAVEILRGLSTARGEQSGEDLEMHLAWLLSEVGEEEEAMQRWHALWQRINSVPRRRYVEDRLMTVASRLGKLADIAIELEQKLDAGTADARDSGLLVRLYTKAGDPVSATEVVEEYMKGAGAAPVKVLVEKSRVFLACNDYHNYEKTIRELIRIDVEGEGDYLRQLAMSQLERGKPDEAREVLEQLKQKEAGSDSAEFEAGVLALAGLRADAVKAYRRGIARYPDRIESFLLMANQMAQLGEAGRAVGIFQHIAEKAEKDDLFTIALDGLLNLDAPAPVLRWARRQALGRLARRHDKMYLYQLIADLSEELGDKETQLRSLEAALPIIGERRSSLLRELMDLTKGPRGDVGRHLGYGRRLIGLGEIAPPGVYLDLGQAFLQNGEVSNAAKTFALATDIPDWGSFQAEVATAFEQAGYREESLRTYQRLLVSSPGDAALLLKVGELQEQVGHDGLAAGLYAQALDLMIARRPLSTVIKEDKQPNRPWYWSGNRNVDDYDQFHARTLTGLLAALDGGAKAEAYLAEQQAKLREAHDERRALLARAAAQDDGVKDEGAKDDDKQAVVRAWPRLKSQAELVRRVAIAYGRPEVADEHDLALLAAFPKDEDLLKELVRHRLSWGLVASARALIDGSGRSDEEKTKLGFLVGSGEGTPSGLVSLLEANRLFLPLLVEGDEQAVRALLRRLDFSRLEKDDQALMPVLQSAALQMQDGRLALALGRHWIKVLMKRDKASDAPYRFQPVLQKIRGLLSTEQYRSLCEYVVSMILDDPKQAGNWLQLIPQLQREFEKPLLDEEQRKSLLEKLDGNRWYWLGSFFSLVPTEQRAAVLRGILPKVPKTRRMQFLLTLIDQVEDEIEGDFADLVVESFRSAYEDMDTTDQFAYYYFLNLARGASNTKLRVRMVRIPIEKKSRNMLVRAAYAVMLKREGQEKEGLALALASLGELFGAKKHYTVNTARNLLLDEFLPEHLDAFVAAVDKRAAGGGSVDLTNFRIDLIRRTNDPDALLAAYRKAVADHPDNDTFKDRLYNQLNSLGHVAEAIELLKARIEKKPDDLNLRNRLMYLYRRLGNTEAVLAIKAEIAAQKESKGEKPRPQVKTWVSMYDVQRAVKEEKHEEAQRLLRRMWRRFQVGTPRGSRGFMMMPIMGARSQAWPVAQPARTDEEPDAKAKKRRRGGLDAWIDDPEERPEAKDSYEVLATLPFGRDEIERQMRTWQGEQLSAGGPVLDGAAIGVAATEGAGKAVKRLLALAEQGRAGKKEYGLLLSLFESAPDEVVKGAAPLLRDLERTLTPTDAGQLRRLARVWARLGDTARAARIYRWCGTRASAGGMWFWGSRESQPISAQDLIDEVGEVLAGEERNATIEAILTMSDPGDSTRFGPTNRDAYEALVLQTWLELVGPEEALARSRAIVDRMAAGSKMPQRRTALLAAGMLVTAGETGKALGALESGLCLIEPPAGIPVHQHFWYRQPGRMTHDDIRTLFPADAPDTEGHRQWLVAVADALPRWVAEERAAEAYLIEPLAILMLRLHAVGESERALALLETLEGWAGDNPRYQLWVADVARALGDTAKADAVERELFDRDRLNLYRIPDVLARVRDAEGADAALALGETKAALIRHPVMLEALASIAEEAGQDDEALLWRKAAEKSKAAAKELAELEKAEREGS